MTSFREGLYFLRTFERPTLRTHRQAGVFDHSALMAHPIPYCLRDAFLSSRTLHSPHFPFLLIVITIAGKGCIAICNLQAGEYVQTP